MYLSLPGSGSTFLGIHRFLTGRAHIPHQPDQAHEFDDHPTGVPLPPLQTVTSRRGKGVMIVVPAFTMAKNSKTQRYYVNHRRNENRDCQRCGKSS